MKTFYIFRGDPTLILYIGDSFWFYLTTSVLIIKDNMMFWRRFQLRIHLLLLIIVLIPVCIAVASTEDSFWFQLTIGRVTTIEDITAIITTCSHIIDDSFVIFAGTVLLIHFNFGNTVLTIIYSLSWYDIMMISWYLDSFAFLCFNVCQFHHETWSFQEKFFNYKIKIHFKFEFHIS